MITINENNLRNIVRSVISESIVLTEGYSAKHFDDQIRNITDEFMEYKDAVDDAQCRNIPQYYPITISLRPFFNGTDRDVEYHYLEDTDYSIKIAYRRIEQGHLVGGSYNPYSLYEKRKYNIELRVPHDAKWEDVYTTLLHEVTHLVDDLIKNCKGHNAPTYPYKQMELANIPDCVRRILYMLWSNTEFNAWQATYKQVIGNADVTEWAIRKLKEANEINDEDVWNNVRLYVSMHNPTSNINNKSAMAFKDYFIKTSFKLIKKMVRKYY